MGVRWIMAAVLALAASVPEARAEPAVAAAAQPAVPGVAAAPSASPRLPQIVPMKVLRVKASVPGCEPTCREWISAEGMIDENTLAQFKKVLKELGSRKLPVLIDSGGGIVDEALAIGRLIRAKGLDIAVTKTTFAPCAGSDGHCNTSKSHSVMLGRPRAYLARCASSCAFILAGGVHRYVGPTAFVGIHQLKTLQTSAQLLRKYRIETRTEWGVPVEVRRILVSEKRVNEKTTVAKTPESAYVKVAKYFAEMGVADSVMGILKSAPNTSIHWMTRAELKATAMATDMIDAETLIFNPPPASQTNTQLGAFKQFGASPLPPPAPAGQ